MSLADLCVLVTRPEPAGPLLCERIRAAGGAAVYYPVMAFAPPQDEQALKHHMEQLSEYEWLIFISPQAVSAALPWASPSLDRSSVRVACVGPATAALLAQQGFTNIIVPDDVFSSEGLLALPVFQSVKGVRIAVIRGEGGREKIDETLKARGASVLSVLAYRRVLPPLLPERQAALQAVLCSNQLDVVLGTSFLSMQHLKQLAGEALWPMLKKIPALVMSGRIQALSLALGFETVWVSEAASEAALLNRLAKERNRLCQMKQQR